MCQAADVFFTGLVFGNGVDRRHFARHRVMWVWDLSVIVCFVAFVIRMHHIR